VFGFFGAYSDNRGAMEAIFQRLSGARQKSMLRIPADRGESADHQSARAGQPSWSALFPIPCVALGSAHDSGITASSRTMVSFVGHLASPVEGIGISIVTPAEVVRIAYGRWGVGCFARLNGNFSVAIYDPKLPGFIVARDVAGTKPVFYSFANNFIFGSSAVEVLRASGMPPVANPRALFRYLLYGAVAGEENTLFDGVYALPGACYVEAVPGCAPVVRPIPFGNNIDPANVPASFAQSSRELRCLLLETVRAQSFGRRIAVPLSGGIDSSGIAACLRAAMYPGEPLHAFCFVHGHPALPEVWNEQPWAEMVVNHVHATLHPVTLQASAIPGAMSRIVRNQEAPFGSPVLLAQAEVFRVAADSGIHAMLSGNGPDTLFGRGNSQFVAHASKLLRRGRIFAAWAVLQGASEYTASNPGRLLISSVRQALQMLIGGDRHPAGPPWAHRSWFLDRVAARHEERPFKSEDPMYQLILDQLYNSSIPTALHFEEHNAAANGIEIRLPFLVAKMLRLADKLPAEYLVSDAGESKYILRNALACLVPGAVLGRRNRIGFAVPALPWLHELRPWVEDRLLELRSLPFFQETSTAAVWENLQGSDTSAWINAYRTWRWITLLEWAKAHDVKFS